MYTGARPVWLIDIDPHTFNIDPALIEAAITSKTKVIMPIHLFGLSADMDTICSIAAKHDLVVIEDACQAHGAQLHGARVGSMGTGAFSFYPTKNITSAEGGMITTNDADFAESCVIRQHGMRRRYYHDELGFNFRMTDIHAAIGLAQLGKLATFNRQRKANASFLSANLRGVVTPVVPDGYEHVFHQYTVRVPDGRRDALLAHLQANGVGTGVYYPVPVHKQTLYMNELGYDLSLPKSERAAAEVLSLPVHPGLSSTDLEENVDVVTGFMEKSEA